MAESGVAAARASMAPSSFAVPEWAVAIAVSNIGETSTANQLAVPTGNHSLEDSQRTCTSPPTSDPKGSRFAVGHVKHAAVLPLDSASGQRPCNSTAHRLQPEADGPSQGGHTTDGRCVKRTAANGSPFGSRFSLKSVIPDLPTEWQAAAGIKDSPRSESTSSCCGRPVHNGDDTSGKGAKLCTRAWWHAAFRSILLEFKKVVEVVRTKPVVVIPGLAVLAIVLGLGLWALIAASNAEERFRHDSASKIANDKALYIQTELDKTFMPAYVVSTTVQQNPNYYPPQPPDLHVKYPNPWYLVNKNFDKLSADLIALTKAGSVRTVSAVPLGIIRTMYPLNGTTTADDRNWGAIGKNWLNDPVNAGPVKLSLSSHNLTIIGPYNLTQGGIGIVGMQAIFVNASQNDTFNIPPGPNGTTGPTSPIPGMLDLTWQPEFTAAPKFWGLCTVLLSWDFLRDNVTNLQDLAAQGYDYILTRPDKNNTNLAVDWSPGVDPRRPPGFNAAVSGTRPLIYYVIKAGSRVRMYYVNPSGGVSANYDMSSSLEDPVIVQVPLPNVEWTLYVSRTGGWVPTWKAPLIAMVVILSLVLSILVFVVLVSRVQQRRLLRDVVAAAGMLASTTRTLEEEKNRMQALLARHFDLIDLLEGGTGGIAASLNGGGGGGGVDSDGSARPRIDILRQKMLLTGTSLRRDQLGETEQITIQELLGEGTFGKVYKGLWRGTEVAIKTIVLPAKMSGKEKREKMAVMEAAISSSLAHPNIVQTYTYHIRPLRDSSAAPSLAPPSPVRTGAAAAAAAAMIGDGSAAGGSGGDVIGGSEGVGRTKVLAEAGAIVMGSPDSSMSTASISVHNVLANQTSGIEGSGATAAALAAVAALGAGGDAAAPPGQQQQLAPEAPTATAKSPAPPGRTPSQSNMRGATLDQSAAGIHSYEVQLVLEFCDRGCLRDALDAGAFFTAAGLNYPAIVETAADVAKAMLHLHLNDVLHSDLKATNVMLKSTGSGDSGRGVIAKVADFGLSVRLDHTATHISHAFQGSLTHMAPEVMLQGHVSRAADVYAFGITLWEIFTGGQAYRGTPAALLGHQTSREGRRPVFPLGTPTAYKELAERCWHPEAAERPTFNEILDLLTKMRTEIPGPTPPLAPVVPLQKRMAAALAADDKPNGHVNGIGGLRGGVVGSSLTASGTAGGSTLGGSGIVPLRKIGAPAAIMVGGRLVSLMSAMQSADSGSGNGRMLPGNSAAAGATLGGLGFPGVLETISEEGGNGDGSRPLPSVKLPSVKLPPAAATTPADGTDDAAAVDGTKRSSGAAAQNGAATAAAFAAAAATAAAAAAPPMPMVAVTVVEEEEARPREGGQATVALEIDSDHSV